MQRAASAHRCAARAGLGFQLRQRRLLLRQRAAQLGLSITASSVALLDLVAGVDLQRDGAGGGRVQRRADRGDHAAVDRDVAHQRAARDLGDARRARRRPSAARPASGRAASTASDQRPRRRPIAAADQQAACGADAGGGARRVTAVLAGGVADHGSERLAGASDHLMQQGRVPTRQAIDRFRTRCARRTGVRGVRRGQRPASAAQTGRPRLRALNLSLLQQERPAMCGIVGAIAQRDVVPLLIEGLKRLEYRGYDSAGIAVLDAHATCAACAAPAAWPRWKRRAQAERLRRRAWASATRAGPRTAASPRPTRTRTSATASSRVVHNGIIENHEEQRERLRAARLRVRIADRHRSHRAPDPPLPARRATTCSAAVQQRGARAASAPTRSPWSASASPDRMVAARMGCPLLVGLGEGENFVASDVSAIVQATRRVIFLEEGDAAEVTREQRARVRRATATPVAARRARVRRVAGLAGARPVPPLHAEGNPRAAARGRRHHRGGDRRQRLLAGAVRRRAPKRCCATSKACRSSPAAPATTPAWSRATGSRRSPACRARSRSPANTATATVVANPKHLVVTISQSGETLDTMEALKYAKSLGHERTLSICNVPESAIPRASRAGATTRAPAPRSAWPRPRRSPRSWWRCSR